MDNFFNYVSTHPIAAIILGALIILIAYFVIKKLLKFALIVGLILVGVAGYYYYKSPDQFSKNLKSTVDDIRGHAKEALIKGKSILEKGKNLVEDIEKKVKEDKKTVGK